MLILPTTRGAPPSPQLPPGLTGGRGCWCGDLLCPHLPPGPPAGEKGRRYGLSCSTSTEVQGN